MISSFKDKGSQVLCETESCRRWGALARVALCKLDMIAAATAVEPLRVPLKKLIHPGEILKAEPQFWLNLQGNYDLGAADSGVWSRVKKLMPGFISSRAVAVL